MEPERCVLCHRHLALASRFGAFCAPCAGGVLHDAARILRMPAGDQVALEGVFLAAGLLALSRCCREYVPFDGERDG